MKALSILQPWASLIVLGHKRIETRGWNTKYRGPLLIHASVGYKKEQEHLAHHFFLMTGDSRVYHCYRAAIIGVVELVGTESSEKIIANLSKSMYWGQEQEQAFGNYSPGRYGWYLSKPLLFPQPIPCKGSLGIWNTPKYMDSEINATIAEARLRSKEG